MSLSSAEIFRVARDELSYVFKPCRHGQDAPLLHPAMRSLPLRSASAPGGSRATRGRGEVVVVQWLRPGEGGAHCAESPPSVQPDARPDPSGPSARRSLGGDRHRGMWVTSGGPDGSGVNGLAPGPLRLMGGYRRRGHIQSSNSHRGPASLRSTPLRFAVRRGLGEGYESASAARYHGSERYCDILGTLWVLGIFGVRNDTVAVSNVTVVGWKGRVSWRCYMSCARKHCRWYLWLTGR